MNETIKTDLSPQIQAKKLKQITLILASVGIVAAISLVYFFLALYRVRSSRHTPQIFEVRQIGATDHAVLLSWSSSKEAESFIVRGKSAGGQKYVGKAGCRRSEDQDPHHKRQDQQIGKESKRMVRIIMPKLQRRSQQLKQGRQ